MVSQQRDTMQTLQQVDIQIPLWCCELQLRTLTSHKRINPLVLLQENFSAHSTNTVKLIRLLAVVATGAHPLADKTPCFSAKLNSE
jgi:hypothetical protein